MLPVNKPDRDMILTRAGLYLHPIPQQLVHTPVTVVEVLAGIGRDPIQFVQRSADESVANPLLLKPSRQDRLFDIPTIAINPVAQVVIAKSILKQGNHAGLGSLFDLTDRAHVRPCLI